MHYHNSNYRLYLKIELPREGGLVKKKWLWEENLKFPKAWREVSVKLNCSSFSHALIVLAIYTKPLIKGKVNSPPQHQVWLLACLASSLPFHYWNYNPGNSNWIEKDVRLLWLVVQTVQKSIWWRRHGSPRKGMVKGQEAGLLYLYLGNREWAGSRPT